MVLSKVKGYSVSSLDQDVAKSMDPRQGNENNKDES